MGDTTKIITIAGICTLAALPLLYTGVVNHNTGILWLSYLLFGFGMATPPILRILRKG